jgi:pimeloyl-ACP methyl ester carboxylesterase
MKKVLEILVKIVVVVAVLGILLFTVAYISQEKLIFFPDKLAENHKFNFDSKFEEKTFKMEDGVKLHALLFKADSSKGVIYYLHGNAGSVNTWGHISNIFTKHDYDLLLLDYRGYGKSEGKIVSEKQMFSDAQKVYDELKQDYDEDKIIVLGYSIGTGMAAKLASENNPKCLLLLAPYYNLPDLVKHIYPIVPRFIVKYKFFTNKFLAETKVPVYLFHGLNDELIPYDNSKKLYEICKPNGELLLLENQTHAGINENLVFQEKLSTILN